MGHSQRKAYCERLDTLPWSQDEDESLLQHSENLSIDTVESLSVNKGPLVECLKLQQICSHPHLLHAEEKYTLESSSKLIFLRHLLRRLYDSPEQRSKNHRVVVLSRSRKLLDFISLYVTWCCSVVLECILFENRYSRMTQTKTKTGTSKNTTISNQDLHV